MTVYFVNEAGQLLKATLALREYKESYGGEQQVEVLIKVLKEYKINAKQIGYITSRFLFSTSTTIKLSTNYTKYR